MIPWRVYDTDNVIMRSFRKMIVTIEGLFIYTVYLQEGFLRMYVFVR